MMREYKIDPELEKCLPPLDEGRYQWIKDQISERGYNRAFPIIIWKNHDIIVDGHHRYKACKELNVRPFVDEQEFSSLEEAILFAIDHQENRRNLSETQRAMMVTKRRLIQERIEARKRSLANLSSSRPTGASPGPVPAIMAKEAKVGEHTVRRVITVVDKGIPELQDMMLKNEISSRAAEDFVYSVPDLKKQNEIVKSGGAKAVKKEVTEIRANQRKSKDARTETQKFEELTKKVDQRVAEDMKKIDKLFGDADRACFLPNVHELWCISCEWGFDVYLPTPRDPKCPYCGGNELEKRKENWYPGVN